MSRIDPVLACNFTLTLNDSPSGIMAVATAVLPLTSVISYPIAGFSECSGLEMTL